eukprot:1194366-Prorocentrum_minimum.AAC.3
MYLVIADESAVRLGHLHEGQQLGPVHGVGQVARQRQVVLLHLLLHLLLHEIAQAAHDAQRLVLGSVLLLVEPLRDEPPHELSPPPRPVGALLLVGERQPRLGSR